MSNEIPQQTTTRSTAANLSEVFFDPPTVWKAIGKLKSSSAPGPDKVTSRILIEARNELCYPLALIFNRSITSGDVPEDWRRANVTPIFKKGNKTSPGNYRPVSLTSVRSKLSHAIIKHPFVGMKVVYYLPYVGNRGCLKCRFFVNKRSELCG